MSPQIAIAEPKELESGARLDVVVHATVKLSFGVSELALNGLTGRTSPARVNIACRTARQSLVPDSFLDVLLEMNPGP